jgi:hypothetical protein
MPSCPSARIRLAGLALLGLLLATPARAQEARTFGLGLIIGDPTGVSAKGFLSADHAIDGAVGLGLIGGHDLIVQADFLWLFPIQRWSSATLDLHLGVGPKLGIKDKGGGEIRLGARAPIGMSVMFLEAPFDVFVEVAAGLWVVKDVKLDVDVAIGGRYWF